MNSILAKLPGVVVLPVAVRTSMAPLSGCKKTVYQPGKVRSAHKRPAYPEGLLPNDGGVVDHTVGGRRADIADAGEVAVAAAVSLDDLWDCIED